MAVFSRPTEEKEYGRDGGSHPDGQIQREQPHGGQSFNCEGQKSDQWEYSQDEGVDGLNIRLALGMLRMRESERQHGPQYGD